MQMIDTDEERDAERPGGNSPAGVSRRHHRPLAECRSSRSRGRARQRKRHLHRTSRERRDPRTASIEPENQSPGKGRSELTPTPPNRRDQQTSRRHGRLSRGGGKRKRRHRWSRERSGQQGAKDIPAVRPDQCPRGGSADVKMTARQTISEGRFPIPPQREVD